MTSPDELDPELERRLSGLARAVTTEDRILKAPPEDLWADIAAAVAAEELHGRSTISPMSPTAVRPAGDVAPASGSVVSMSGAAVRARRRRSLTLGLSIAAAAAVVVGAVAVVTSLDGNEDRGNLVAASSLDPLADGYDGAVELRNVDGRLSLDVDLSSLPGAGDGYYELWLIKDLATGEMQSLGPIESSESVVLPTGLDPTDYAVVDISIEPLDGVPTHSGQSVLRGTLDA